MSQGPLEAGVELVPVLCTECGLPFGVPREYFDARVADQRPFSCMNGHAVALGVPRGVDALVRGLEQQLADTERQRDQWYARAEQALEEVAALRGSVVNALVGSATAGGAT